MPAPKGHPPYPGCETGGRPRYYTEERLDLIADELEEWMLDPKNVFIEDFCFSKKICDDEVNTYCERSKKFSRSIKRVKQKQKAALMKMGLNKKGFTPMSIFLLKCNHNMREEQQSIQNTDLETLLSNIAGSSKELVNDQIA